MNRYPRETVVLQQAPVTNEVTGETVPAAEVQLALTAAGARPVTWEPPTVVESMYGVMVTGLTPGFYTVWAKVTSAPPETPVLELGTFEVY